MTLDSALGVPITFTTICCAGGKIRLMGLQGNLWILTGSFGLLVGVWLMLLKLMALTETSGIAAKCALTVIVTHIAT